MWTFLILAACGPAPAWVETTACEPGLVERVDYQGGDPDGDDCVAVPPECPVLDDDDADCPVSDECVDALCGFDAGSYTFDCHKRGGKQYAIIDCFSPAP